MKVYWNEWEINREFFITREITIHTYTHIKNLYIMVSFKIQLNEYTQRKPKITHHKRWYQLALQQNIRSEKNHSYR
jgi:hypothetical protein